MNILKLIKRSIGREELPVRAGYWPEQAPERLKEGPETWRKLMEDPVICGAVDILILKTVGEGVRLAGRGEICSFLTEMLKGFSVPFSEILRQAMTALIYGSAVSEKVFGYRNGRFLIEDLKFKPRESYRFALDNYNNIKGVVRPARTGEVIPREKLFIFTNKGDYGNPAGASALAPCLPLWRMKREKMAEYCKYLSLYASPALIGTLPPEAANIDKRGFLRDLSRLKSGGVMAVTSGVSVSPVSVQNNESMYLNFIDFCNREMTTAILGSTRATMEAKHGSKADSETSLSLVRDRIKFYRQNLAEAVKDQLLFPIVEANFGRERAEAETPACEFIPDDTEDLISYGNMVANLCAKGFLDPSQKADIDPMLKLPKRK